MIAVSLTFLFASASVCHCFLHPPESQATLRKHFAPRFKNETGVVKRATESQLSTCGYLNGDPEQSRTANLGFNCRVDVSNGLWGFCPTTVITASDCGLAGSCKDLHACSNGCGKTGRKDLMTFTCGYEEFCSTALLTVGVDQTYSYIACGAGPSTDHYLISPTTKGETPKPTDESESPSESTLSGEGGTSPSATPSAPSPQETGGNVIETGPEGSPNNTGAIIGGVIGGLALVCGFGVAAIYLLRRDRAKRAMSPEPAAQQIEGPPKYDMEGYKGPNELGTSGPRHELPISVEVRPVELAG